MAELTTTQRSGPHPSRAEPAWRPAARRRAGTFRGGRVLGASGIDRGRARLLAAATTLAVVVVGAVLIPWVWDADQSSVDYEAIRQPPGAGPPVRHRPVRAGRARPHRSRDPGLPAGRAVLCPARHRARRPGGRPVRRGRRTRRPDRHAGRGRGQRPPPSPAGHPDRGDVPRFAGRRRDVDRPHPLDHGRAHRPRRGAVAAFAAVHRRRGLDRRVPLAVVRSTCCPPSHPSAPCRGDPAAPARGVPRDRRSASSVSACPRTYPAWAT